MVDFSKIKLVVWDLDETFWSGILSEGDVVPFDKCLNLVRKLTDCGIVNSICSKNDFAITESKLTELGVWDLFVFPSIDWSPKGQRISALIKDMALRPVNALFIDDNVMNLNEAKHYSPDLMIAEPDIIDELLKWASEESNKKDVKHTRLEQYKVLYSKKEASLQYSSNEEFLYASNIIVDIHRDCLSSINRIHELILRSNQLNYTKKRITLEELEVVLNDSNYDTGYVTVKDDFGDYGIVGFFAMREHYLEHFLFSCRTIGQGIEQYVYALLGFPKLNVVGDVVSKINSSEKPGWINKDSVIINHTEGCENSLSGKILIKGPCDLLSSKAYINAGELDVDSEFTYVADDGRIIEGYNHSVHIQNDEDCDNMTKKEMLEDCVFIDENMFNSTFFLKDYDVIFLSTLIESGYGIYKKRGKNIKVAFGSWKLPLTDRNNWSKYIDGTVYNGNNRFTVDDLERFSERYEFCGHTQPDDYIIFLRRTLSKLNSKTKLCLILGVDKDFHKDSELCLLHKKMNDEIRKFAKEEPRILYIDINDFIENSADTTDTINHFQTRVYYDIAKAMTAIIQQNSSKKVRLRSVSLIVFDNVINVIKNLIVKVCGSKQGKTIHWMKNVYRKLSRKER